MVVVIVGIVETLGVAGDDDSDEEADEEEGEEIVPDKGEKVGGEREADIWEDSRVDVAILPPLPTETDTGGVEIVKRGRTGGLLWKWLLLPLTLLLLAVAVVDFPSIINRENAAMVSCTCPPPCSERFMEYLPGSSSGCCCCGSGCDGSSRCVGGWAG